MLTYDNMFVNRETCMHPTTHPRNLFPVCAWFRWSLWVSSSPEIRKCMKSPSFQSISKHHCKRLAPGSPWVARLLAATVWINCFSKRGLPPCPIERIWAVTAMTLGISAGLAFCSRLQDEVQWTTHLTHPQQDATLSRLLKITKHLNIRGFRWFPSCNKRI